MKSTFIFMFSFVLILSSFYACSKETEDSCESINCNAQESCYEAKCYVNLQDTFFGLADITAMDTSLSNLPMYFFISNDSIPNIYGYTLHIDIDSVLEVHIIRETTLQNDSIYFDDLVGVLHSYGDIVFVNNFATVNGYLQTEHPFFITGELTFTASR